MTLPAPKIEIGFDLTESPIGPFFRLDDPEAGLLDNLDYRLGGTIFYDVTDRARTVSSQRGRPNEFAGFPAGQVTVEFNNHDRAFDPLFVASPFYGNIVPRREIRLSVDDERVFTGWIEDWDLQYTPDGDSTVSAIAYDAFYIITNQSLSAFTPSVETVDERINTVLSRPGVGWSTDLRNLEVSTQNVGAYAIEEGTNALSYLQGLVTAEPGNIFVDKGGSIAFTNRQSYPTSQDLVQIGESGIPFDNLRVIYGAEDLYNEVTISRKDGGTAIASDIASQGAYGIRALNQTDLLVETDDQIAEIAVEYASRFSQPEYRIEAAEIDMQKLSAANRLAMLGLDLGDVVQSIFTPNNIPPAINKYLEIINIEHIVTADTHYITLGFKEITYAPLVLDDAVFGKLDVGTLSW